MFRSTGWHHGEIIVAGKHKKMFARKDLFRKLRDKTHEKMRDALRARVLSYPRISLSTLRWFIISQNRLTPISNLSLMKLAPATPKRKFVQEGFEIDAYPNTATFSFAGSPILLESSPGPVGSYFGSAEIGVDWFIRTYPQQSTLCDEIRRKAEDDMVMMRFWLQGQGEAIEWYNAWLEGAVDRAIAFYADHIVFWRLEGKLDQARLEARLKRGGARTKATTRAAA